MASSDSEGFESADEGQHEFEKTSRKHRKSSSNYSDNAVETAPDSLKPTSKAVEHIEEAVTAGWDDFDVDVPETESVDDRKSSGFVSKSNETRNDVKSKDLSQGWDEFDDWGDDGGTHETTTDATLSSQLASTSISKPCTVTGPEPSTAGATSPSPGPHGSVAGPPASGWGWGWGVDSLLSTATAGITSLTTQVSQGLTTVIESGIGAPDPEELARRPPQTTSVEEVKENMVSGSDGRTVEDGFQFGSILKLVGSTGSKVVTGGLDTLESLGRKTMDILTDGDPGMARKRALIGLEQRPVLSAVLREAAARPDPASEPHQLSHTGTPAKEMRYESIFDDFGGLMHLEALEMLSRQLGLRIEQRLGAADAAARGGLRETLQQVEELCEMADDDDDGDVSRSSGATLHEALLKATEDLGVKLQFEPLVKQYEGVITFLDDDTQTPKAVYKHAITSLAEATALAVEIYHKAAEMLLVKARRSTADEADSLTQMTVVLTKHLNHLALLFTDKLNAIHNKDDKNVGEQNANEGLIEKSCGERNTETEVKEDVTGYVTTVFLEAENSCKYLQNALRLELPVLQIGAV